ncbi:thiol reductant ABC exporter subunit CydD [Phaeacidiphilus oryzae]|uniref:thiol reductant ABC exporter subunit CydD n=1 Tax=Phaeacidiphilus oryzae TaxID=348818 RepID=UPI00055E5774|nr:thiol reductant ABC exporter subunit CydD [Phaeacidiphilus oryzae]
MKPVDPRLLRYARGARVFLTLSVLLGAAGAVLVIAQAVLITDLVVGAFQHGRGLGSLGWEITALAAVAVGRGLVGWLTEAAAHRASAGVKSELRGRLLARAAELGPRGGLDGRHSTGELAALAVRGVDALDAYFSRYLPQLALAVIVPVAVLARIVLADWVSAVIVVCTLPLIPVFMILIGLATQNRMDRQWALLGRLSHHFLDVVEGLPTLKVFGRAKAQAASIRRVTAEYRRATLRTLRIAFVSSFALELLSTLSVALVAVTVGTRLVDGSMTLSDGLLVLVLAPEAYLPIRQVGTHYHASAEGLAAAGEVFAVLEAGTEQADGGGVVERPAAADIEVDELTVRHPGRPAAALKDVSLTVRAGETVALTGPSGAGKSTLLSVLLGLGGAERESGRVQIGGQELAGLDPARWRRCVAWVPQRPYLFAGTIAENVRLARPEADDRELAAALRAAQAAEFVAALPEGAETVLGEGGSGLSAGQRQRIALTRAFLADRPVVLLDEPTANLDGESEAAIVAAVRELARGRTVLLTAHRPALLAVADRVVALPAPEAARDSDGPGDGARASAAGEPPAAAAAPAPAAAPDEAETAVAAVAAGAREAREGEGRRAGAIRRVRRLALAEGGGARPRFAAAVLLGALALGCAIALLGTSGWLISRASQQPPILYLMVAMTLVRAFGIGRSFFRYAERLLSHDAVFRGLAGLRVNLFRALERLAPAGGRGLWRRGDLLSRLVEDVDAVQDHFLRFVLPAASAILVCAGTVLAVGLLLPAAGAAVAAGLLLAGLAVPLLASRVSRNTERRLAPAKGALATQVVELLAGAEELTVAGALPERLRRLRETDAGLVRLAGRSAGTEGLGAGLVALLSGLTVAGCAAIGVAATASGRIHGVLLAVLILTPLAAFEAVAGLPAAAQARQRGVRAAERLVEVGDEPAPVREPAEPARLPDASAGLPVRARDLTVRYPGRAEPALAGLDLDLSAGRRIAVVGPSGSGKTTLALALLRFLDPSGGRITLTGSGVDATTLAGDDVRRVIGLCAQDAHVFDSSLRQNLRLARPDGTADEELWSALDAARLGDWVRGLPEGLDTMVGEHGARLSGGQRQRLALARALLADFPLLVLDEPAEHLDLETADALTADLLAATEGRTTLIITHRLAGLDAVDEIVVLDRGRTAERGTWAELTTRENGRLRAMWQRERAADALVPQARRPALSPTAT